MASSVQTASFRRSFESNGELLHRTLLQNRTCDFHHIRLLNDLALVTSTIALERVVIPILLNDISVSRRFPIVTMTVQELQIVLDVLASSGGRDNVVNIPQVAILEIQFAEIALSGLILQESGYSCGQFRMATHSFSPVN